MRHDRPRRLRTLVLEFSTLLLTAWLLGHPVQAQDWCSFASNCDACLPGDGCDAYGGDSCALCTSPQLTGNWGGARTTLGEHGISADLDATMWYMGVVDGGLDQDPRFSGHNDYVFNMDLGKLGLSTGTFVKLRAENRYGESMSGATGALLPSNINADLPIPDSTQLYLTNVLITQFLSESFGVYFGKLDTFDGDPNAFASGRGKTQFSNAAFVVNPVTFRTVPYCTLGAGFVILGENQQPLFTVNVLNTTDTANTSGFDELFANGAVVAGELRLPTSFLGMPGHQLFGATWSSRTFVSLDQDGRIILPDVPVQRETGSWSAYWNFDQYLHVDPSDPTRGWGIFGRAGLADNQTNPVEWFLSFGLGGNVPLPSRSADTFGIGWYYSATSPEVGAALVGLLGGLGDGQGVELFYNIAVTPWLQLTPDLQIIMPAREVVETATVVGVRGRVIF